MKQALALAGLGLLLAPAAQAATVTEQVQSGQVTATLSYDKRGERYRDFRVRIVRAGQTLVDRALERGCDACFPANRGANLKSIALRDLDRDGEPEVIADVYTGGAHCCTISNLFGFQPSTGSYDLVRRNWRDAGYRLRDLGRDGTLEFDSRDARFAYAFSSYAESYLPLQVFRWSGGRLVDVTRSFRRQLRRDAARAYRLYRRYRRDDDVNVRGFLAGYAASKYRLGQRRSADRALRRAVRRGDVTPRGRTYIRQLKRFLRRLGY